MAIQKAQKIAKFSAAPNAEVLGVAMLALPVCLKADEIMPLLKKHGFADIDAEKWYPQQSIVNLYRDIEEGRSNVSESLVAIGINSPAAFSGVEQNDLVDAGFTTEEAQDILSRVTKASV